MNFTRDKQKYVGFTQQAKQTSPSGSTVLVPGESSSFTHNLNHIIHHPEPTTENK
jgi:hypothetical protein